jgi:hypothetical protein
MLAAAVKPCYCIHRASTRESLYFPVFQRFPFISQPQASGRHLTCITSVREKIVQFIPKRVSYSPLIASGFALSILGLGLNRIIRALTGRKAKTMDYDSRYSMKCSPPAGGTGQARVQATASACSSSEERQTLKEACDEVLLSIQKAQEARHAYAAAQSIQWYDYKVEE